MPSEEGRRTYVCYLRIFGLLQLGLGVAQVICGSFAVKYTAGEKDSFGPPYFTGAFIVGGLIFIAGIISLIICKKANSLDSGGSDVMQDISCLMCAEMGLSVAACMGSFIGLFFVAIFGVPDCDPSEWASHCNYTINISENRRTAIFILLFILASVAVSITVICCNCRYGSEFGVSFNRRRGPLTVVGGTHRPVASYQATPTPVVTETGYKYAPVVVGGTTPNTAYQPSNYSASAQYQPHTAQFPAHPAQFPARPAQFPDQTTQYPTQHAQHQPQTTNPTINELQEQNRLLQEQIRLQQQQLELQHQLQQQAGQGPSMTTPMYTPPPPSYEQCTSDENAIRQLEEHNKELQRHSQQQQEVLEKQLPPPGPMAEPSAPP